MADINPEYLAGLAQLETRNGNKAIPGTNNLYNIKDFSGGGVKAHDKAEGSNDAYRVYATPEDSTADLKSLLARKYPKALTATTPQEFAQALKDGGYATDPQYVAKLTSVITGGKYDPVAQAMAATAPVHILAGVGQGVPLNYSNEFSTVPGATQPAGKTKAGQAFDEDGNPVNTNAIEHHGILLATLANGSEGTAAAQGNISLAASLGLAQGPSPTEGATSTFPAAEAASGAAQIDTAERNAIPFSEKVAQASLQGTLIGALVRRNAFDEDGPAVPGYQPPPEALIGKTQDQVDELRAATNPTSLNRIQFDQDQMAQASKIVQSTGPWSAFAAGAFATAGDPLSYVGPYAAARTAKVLGFGSAALAEEGRGVAAGLTAFGENAVANVGQQAIIAQVVNEHMSAGDTIAGMAMAAIPGVLHGYSGWAAGERHAFALDLAKTQDAVIAKERDYANKAMANLGDNATPDMIRAEMDRLQTNDIKDVAQGNTTRALPNDRQLMPEPEKVQAELASEEKIAAEAEKPAPEGGVKPEPSEEQVQADTLKAAQEKQTEPQYDPMAARFASEKPDFWTTQADAREATHYAAYRDTKEGRAMVADQLEGAPNLAWVEKQAPGVHVLPGFEKAPGYGVVSDAMKSMYDKFFSGTDTKITLGTIGPTQLAKGAEGNALSVGRNTHLITLDTTKPVGEALAVAVHEMSHALFHQVGRNIPTELLNRLVGEHGSMLDKLRTGKNVAARFARQAEGQQLDAAGKIKTHTMGNTSYVSSFDEWLAEGGTRFAQRDARGANILGFGDKVKAVFGEAWEKVKALYDFARRRNYIPKDEAIDEFFTRAAQGEFHQRASIAEAAPDNFDSGLRLPDMKQTAYDPAGPLKPLDEVATKHGLETLPEATLGERTEKRMMTYLYQKADEWQRRNPKDAAWDARAKSLTDNNVFNVASTGLLMLKSENPVVRMIASELLEDAGGVAGHRNSTAAISKYMHEKLFVGNFVNDFQSAYDRWKKDNGGSVYSDLMDGKNYDKFNRAVAEETEARRVNGRPSQGIHEAVTAGADHAQSAYERMRQAQVAAKTLGWAGLPETSVGYMPHKMSSVRVRALTNDEQGVLTNALVDQFISVNGWDHTFSQNLAGRYVDRMKQKALGGYDAPVGIHDSGASDIVEDALTAMGLNRQQVLDQLKRYADAGPGYTKKRLNLDLNQVHETPGGGQMKLMDLFNTDQLSLMRQQAGRVSGEVALARQGIFGKPGLALVRRAMGYGADGERAMPRELEAFDQVSAELLGEPFGTAEGKWMNRARTLNGVARLGGIVFNQFAEFINGAAHVGTGRTLSAISSIGRLRGEIIALAAGKKVENPLLTSLEHVGGAEFGTEAYKVSFPYDELDQAHPTYGRDTITATDRLLRGAGHLQSKISFWRAIHSSQQRGFAEQIVQKAAQYIRSGADDAALNDMGIHAGLRARLQADIGNIATFDASGKLTSFDLMKAKDTAAAEEFTQAVHRGISQIIQGNFIGETGKWAHSGYLKMLTQFRAFSILSVEKQWARQRNNQGTAKALGILVGSMSVAVPVYMARTYAASVGRSDQQEYLEKQLAPYQLTRATMNYIALSGLAGDFLDALTAVAPDAVQEKIGTATGGRTGTTTTAVGNLIAPAAGYVNDAWGALQNLDKPEKALKILPFSRVPYLIPAINALGSK